MVDAMTVIQNERLLLSRRWDSEHGKNLAFQALRLTGRESDPVLSADQADEVFGLLVSSAGDCAIADAQAVLDEAELRARQWVTRFSEPSSRIGLREAFPEVQQQIQLARTVRDRLAAMRSKQPGAAPPGLIQPAPSEVVEIHALFLAGAGQRYVDDLNRQIASMEQELPVRLKQVIEDLRVASEGHANGSRNHGQTAPHVAMFDRFAWLVWRRKDLEDRIARVTLDQTKAVSVQAAAVSAVITAAGGPDAVVKAMTDSRRLRDLYWPSHPEWSATAKNSATLNQLRAQLAKLGDNPTGPTADQLKADLATAEASWKSNTSAVDADLQAKLAATVTAAMAGDEPARVEILGDALGESRAFPAGFADQLDAAMFPKSRDGSALLALVLSTGLPLV